MKKFTSIQESVPTSKFLITDKQWYFYKRKIEEILKSFYNQISITDLDGGVLNFVERQNWENPNRVKSIINYANTNHLLLYYLVDSNSSIIDFNSLINFLENNKTDLFVKGGKYFDTVISKLSESEETGIRNEEYACRYLKSYIDSIGKSCNIERTDNDCNADLILGIDIYFTIESSDRKWTVQVKPLKGFVIKDNKYEIISSGMIKKYKINYYIFTNTKTNRAMIFKSTDVIVDSTNRKFIFPLSSFVK
jgi:hypothetical protein